MILSIFKFREALVNKIPKNLKLGITAGIGLPIRLWGSSSMNIGFEYGRMSAPQSVEVSGSKVGLTTQNYFKLSIGFSLFSHDTKDYWFVRQKFD